VRAAVAVLLLVVAPSAAASVFIANSPAAPALRVDAKGNAEVSWRAGGARETVIVPAHGQLSHGGSLPGADVSRPATVPGLAFARVVRRTPDGRLWALEVWQPQPGGPRELHLARWTGAPTKLSLAFDGTHVTGRATFHGKPVAGHSYTLEGKRPRIYVYLDYLAGGTWHRMLGVPPKADGTFTVFVRPTWKGTRYRATMIGANTGSTFEPDASASVPAT
jgi:hypothetical protein